MLKKSACLAMASATIAARGVSIIVPISSVEVIPSSSAACTTQLRASASSSAETVRGIITSTIGLPPAATRSRTASSSARTCIGVQARLHHRQAHATHAEHRVVLRPVLRSAQQSLLLIGEPLGRGLELELVDVGEELVERRVEQAHGDRQPVHLGEDLDEVLVLDLAQLVERFGLLVLGAGQDHATHDRQTVVAQEHVLGSTEPDPLGAELARVGGIRTVVGVRADLQLAATQPVGPRQDRVELGNRFGQLERRCAEHDLAGGAVERDQVALGDDGVAHGELLARHADSGSADHGGLPPAASDHRRVGDEPTTTGQDARCRHHPVDVLGVGLLAHQDDGLHHAPHERPRRSP